MASLELTYRELCFLERCLTRMQQWSEETAADFRRPPISEDIARSYDQDVAAAKALLVRLDAAMKGA